MEAVYPAGASALSRGRRRRAAPRARRTTPVTFAEIKEVDEEGTEACAGEATVASAGTGAGEGRGRRRDELGEPLGAQFHEFRRRRARRDHPIKERAEEPPCPPRAASEPRPAPPALPPSPPLLPLPPPAQ